MARRLKPFAKFMIVLLIVGGLIGLYQLAKAVGLIKVCREKINKAQLEVKEVVSDFAQEED